MRNKLVFFLAIIGIIAASGQNRVVTPVDKDDKKPAAPTLHYYDKHGDPLDEPVLFLADLDTVKNVGARPVYPLLNNLSLGANFFDGVMKIAGQSYASFDIWGALSIYNWVSPVVELGLGFADNSPEGSNFRYVCHPSFYAKVGFNYNFLYKSNPDYQVYLGFRAGYSSLRYDVNDITISNGYWGQTENFSIRNQHADAFFGEALAGLQVKIAGPISFGWSFRYHFKMHVSNGANSTPWFIPGYGARSPITMTASVIYTLPLQKNENTKQTQAE